MPNWEILPKPPLSSLWRAQCHSAQPLLLPPKIPEHNPRSSMPSSPAPLPAPAQAVFTPHSCRGARLLLRHGAPVDLPSEAGGDTALNVAPSLPPCLPLPAAPGPGDHSLGLFQLLAAHGADLEPRDEGWRRPWHRAEGTVGWGSAGNEGPAAGRDGASAAHRDPFSPPKECQRQAWHTPAASRLRVPLI